MPKRGLGKQTLTREGRIKSQGNSRRPSRSAQRLGALPATLPRPEWARQTNPHARGAYKKSGELPTALSLCAEARGSSCNLAETRMGSANEPSVQTKRICEGRMKKSGDPRPSSCSRRRLGGSSCTQKPRQKHDKGHRARYGSGVRRLGLQEVLTAAPGQWSQGRLWGEPTNGRGPSKQSLGAS